MKISRMKKATGAALSLLFLAAPALASQEVNTGLHVDSVRAQANGTVRIYFEETLTNSSGSGVCSKQLIASANKDQNHKIQKLAAAALLAGRAVHVRFETVGCEINYLEME